MSSSVSTTLEATYRAYLDAINARDWKKVATYVSPRGTTHNGRSFTPDEYANMCNVTSSPYQGITFTPERIIINSADDRNGELFCRIRFDYTGSEEPFFEHVLYDWENGKIIRVLSIVEERTV